MPLRFCIFAACFASTLAVSVAESDSQLRPASSESELRFWLENMAWHHHYTAEEMQQVTGLSAEELREQLQAFNISDATRPPRPDDRLLVQPYPGGRHPRIGFLDGAVDPQRDTKLSVFCPWDDRSYAVLDFPEAVWSNLGLTYLAHTHVPTVWTRQGIDLPRQEWEHGADGRYFMHRRLPNGISFGTEVVPLSDHLEMKMWLTNGTAEPLSDLRVQNCVMLKGADGFTAQTNDNKRFERGYSIARSADGGRWIISAWDPVQRNWGNVNCPCLHSDPKFQDCPPGQSRWLRGWFSFYEGNDIDAELDRIEATAWRSRELDRQIGNVVGSVTDATTGESLPCRIYVENIEDGSWHYALPLAHDGTAIEYRRQRDGTASVENHTTVSAGGFQLVLTPGRYRIRAEHGKEYTPAEATIEVTPETDHHHSVQIDLTLRRFVSMSDAGWYSGDTHVHRSMGELPNVLLAEDLNVALPLNYWVRDSRDVPQLSGDTDTAEIVRVDADHVIWPVNTEYEIFTVDGQRHTLGAVFVLHHRKPLTDPAPPVKRIAEAARRQSALLDLDKHSWNWSLMIIPVMQVDLFELSNNHNWRTQFGFPQWTLENTPDWPEIERTDAGFTEQGWTEFARQTYYALLNCGFRMRVTAGTASGVHPVPLGYGRVYVHTGDTFSLDRWMEGLDAGHSFITTGPLLDLRFNDDLPGSTWQSEEANNSISVTGTLHSLQPLTEVEIVRNGVVVQRPRLTAQRAANGTYQYELAEEVPVSGSGWIAVRCTETGENNRVRFAHTNPVFVDVDGHPLRPRRREVEYFVRRMEEELERNQGVLTPEALEEYVQARDVYREILAGAAD